MAYVMCPRHGGHGASAVCRHLLDAMRAGNPLGPMASMEVDFEGSPLGPIWYCQACATRYGIPPDGLRLTGEDGLDRMFNTDWTPACPACFREAGGPDEQAGRPATTPTVDYQPPQPPSDLKWQWRRVKEWGMAGTVVLLAYAAVMWLYFPHRGMSSPPPTAPPTPSAPSPGR